MDLNAIVKSVAATVAKDLAADLPGGFVEKTVVAVIGLLGEALTAIAADPALNGGVVAVTSTDATAAKSE